MLLQSRIGLGLILAGLLGVCQPSLAQTQITKDWPTFRGNLFQTGVTDAPLPDVLAVRWTFKGKTLIGGSPIIFGQTVFAATLDGKLHALDLATGKTKWEYQAATFDTTPAAHDGCVYIGDAKGKFHCIDATTGKKRWIAEVEGQINAPANFGKDKILFGSDDHHLYCVSTAGKLLWQHETKEKVRGAPAIVGDRALFAGCDQKLYVVELDKGKEVATMPVGGHVGSSIAVAGDQAYVGNMANQVLAVNWRKKTVLWQFEAAHGPQPFYSSPALTDDLVVVGSRDKSVHALHRQTGKPAWAFATRGRVDSSPAIVGKRVIVGSLDGYLYVLDLVKGIELARFDLGPISCAPAIGGDCAVIATVTGDVVCLGAKK